MLFQLFFSVKIKINFLKKEAPFKIINLKMQDECNLFEKTFGKPLTVPQSVVQEVSLSIF